METPQQRFEAARAHLAENGRPRGGIGTLGEKELHAVLKYTYEPDAAFHEQKCGPYVADILNAEGVTEIQTRGFTPLRRKLEYMLPLLPVHVVHPMAAAKYLRWVDPETGEVSPPRKSPKQQALCEACFELFKIIGCIGHPHFRLTILMLDVEETRLKNGWSPDGKKGSTRMDRIPLRWVQAYEFTRPEDYLQLLPPGLPEEFTLRDLCKAARIGEKRGRQAIQFLRKLHLLETCGKSGRLALYRPIPPP